LPQNYPSLKIASRPREQKDTATPNALQFQTLGHKDSSDHHAAAPSREAFLPSTFCFGGVAKEKTELCLQL
jgi:hypothetical protein